MVREIIAIQVGQCGNQIGNAFWDTMTTEHSLSDDGKFIPNTNSTPDAVKLAKMAVYFNEAGKARYVPRAVLVDLEPGVLDKLRESNVGHLFKPDNFVFGIDGGANNWAKTHYQDGPELIEEIRDVIRREAEMCECLQGFQLSQSLGGGTGSGVGSLIQLRLREDYSDRIILTFSVFPSPKVSDVVVEPYNTTLCMPMLMEDSDEVVVIDNEALYNISQNILKQTQPTYADLNWIISLVMSGCTSSLRFPGRLNGDLRKMGVNLVPFPRLHFFLVAQAPLFSKSAASNDSTHTNINVQEILDQMWSSRNFLANVNLSDGKYLSASCIYRGENLKTYEVEDEQVKIQMKMSEDFVNWIPNNIMTSVVNVDPPHGKLSGSFVANFTGINRVFQRIVVNFGKLYKRKAFLHWYTDVGMDELEIQEADKNVRDLITEYQDKNDAIVDEDDPMGDGGDGDDEDIIGDDSEEDENALADDDDEDDDDYGIVSDSDDD